MLWQRCRNCCNKHGVNLEMKRLDRLKGAFLALISHKLKTPLTSLSLGLEEMERYASSLNPDDPCHQRLSSMREDMAQFSQVLSTLLRMQQVMVGQASPRIKCDLAEVIHEALGSVESKTDQHKLVLNLAELPLVMADHGRLSFAVQQILDNAFKFSDPGDTVIIALNRSGKKISIVVQDSGCGISKEELPRIFDKFYQIDPDLTGQVPGFGLGLFCAREVVHQHGGMLAIESELHTGTTVTITLAAAEE